MCFSSVDLCEASYVAATMYGIPHFVPDETGSRTLWYALGGITASDPHVDKTESPSLAIILVWT